MRTILILRTASQPLTDIELFLRSRGFKVYVVHLLHEAIQFITDQRPDFSFLSTDLIPPRNMWIFGILNQLTGIILYTEKITASSLIVSKELKNTYMLEPPLTPLGFEQMLRRVDRDHRHQVQTIGKMDSSHLWIMSALSELALKALCRASHNARPTDQVEKVERATRLMCFQVQTTRLNGYFVLAYGRNRRMDAAWVLELQGQLKEYLKVFDENAVAEGAEEIEIKEIQFNEWSRDQAEFMRQAVHQEAEIVMAFFKDPVQLQVQDSLREDYVEVGVEHLPSNSIVNFDVYIYLPQNARFILYTPRGGTLYESQKQKLLSDNIRSVHIHKRSLNEVRAHRAREFINSSVAAFS